MSTDNYSVIEFCPGCGSPGFSNSASNAWQCRQCDFVYYYNSAAAVAGIIKCNEEILLTIRKNDPGKGLLDLPGGFVDPGESLEEALIREIKEELACHINTWRYLISYPNRYEYKGIVYDTTDAFFQTDLKDKPAITAGDDVAGIVWMPIQSIAMDDVALDSIRRIIRHLTSPAGA